MASSPDNTNPNPGAPQPPVQSPKLLFGKEVDDLLIGGSGDDLFFGSGGNDNLKGLAGDDYINGGAGNDFLDGGVGNDTLFGGHGYDTFIFNVETGSKGVPSLSSGLDFINDFSDDDAIRIHSTTVNEFWQLGVTQVGNDTVIGLSSDSFITLRNIDAATIDADDFVFV